MEKSWSFSGIDPASDMFVGMTGFGSRFRDFVVLNQAQITMKLELKYEGLDYPNFGIFGKIKCFSVYVFLTSVVCYWMRFRYDQPNDHGSNCSMMTKSYDQGAPFQ